MIDSSSAILLYRADLLTAMARACHLVMVPAVYAEITVGGRSGAATVREACSSGLISLVETGDTVNEDASLSALGVGERKTLMAFGRENAHFIIIDDRKGARACQARDIPYINALLCPKILHCTGHIDTQTFQRAFQRIQSIGRYSSAIIDYAMNCTSEMLGQFCPDPLIQGSDEESRPIDKKHSLNN